MADKAKLLKVAQKHLSKGNVDKAISTFEQLVAIDPRDQRLLLRLAELQARAGRKKEAIQSYEKIAAGYVAQDFTPKAIAVYKTILRLDPELISAYEKLAELYKSQGLEAEALTQLENLFNFFEKKREDARRKGQVAMSREVSSAMILLGALGFFYFAGSWMFWNLSVIVRRIFQNLGTLRFESINDASVLSMELLDRLLSIF